MILKLIANSLTHLSVKKDKTILAEGDYCYNFYGVIKGKIGLVHSKPVLKPNTLILDSNNTYQKKGSGSSSKTLI